MTYYAGMGPRLSQVLDLLHPGPRVECDGCLKVALGTTKKGHMTAWLRENRAPKGWQLVRVEADDKTPLFRRDYCPKCRQSGKG